MDINDKKLKRTSFLINTTITVVLAGFLILLSEVVIGDMDKAVTPPNVESFRNQTLVDEINKNNKPLYAQISLLREQQDNISKMISVAKENKEAEQESFDNWITTRNTLGNTNQDKEVLQRVEKLDQLQGVVQSWQTQWDSIDTQITKLNTEIAVNDTKYSEEENKAYEQYYIAQNKYDIHVFLIRLLLVAPILALGIFFFIRYRKSKFSSLFMGFTLFSVWIFFVGLVPYLPSYGGYIRYTVGVLLTAGLGYYALRRLKEYSDQKRSELKASVSERAKKLVYETAERAFNNHVCPSCGKDFFLKNWEKPVNIDKSQVFQYANYCRFCGLQLFKKCPQCEHSNYAHLPYCTTCGANVKDE